MASDCASTVIVTARPARFEVAATVYVAPPATAVVGAVVVNVTTCVPWPTMMDCSTVGAALKPVLPVCTESTRHVPLLRKLTIPPLMTHVAALTAGIANVTGKPLVAEAVGV
jgi:hypothetical protein